MAPYIRREDWEACECRVEANVHRILAMLAERDIRATFFTLGWIAERYPQVVREIGGKTIQPLIARLQSLQHGIECDANFVDFRWRTGGVDAVAESFDVNPVHLLNQCLCWPEFTPGDRDAR